MCPSRIIKEAPWTLELMDWWYFSSTFDGLSGQPAGPPDWPYPGGYARQPNKLIQAVKLLRIEWQFLDTKRRAKAGSV